MPSADVWKRLARSGGPERRMRVQRLMEIMDEFFVLTIVDDARAAVLNRQMQDIMREDQELAEAWIEALREGGTPVD